MRDRKLSDQTLPIQEAGTLVSPLVKTYDLATTKSRRLGAQPPAIVPPGCGWPNLILRIVRECQREFAR